VTESIVNPPGLIGLENQGNNCYMNATLQCLMSLKILERYILKLKLSDNKSKAPFLYALQKIFIATRPQPQLSRQLSSILPIML
jgi:ubiquitin C-terminal hydrolase